MGLGTGWYAKEFVQFLGAFPSVKDRVQGFTDTLAIISSMFQNNYTTYNGSIFTANHTLNSPQPTQEHIPIMTAAFREKTITISTKYADIIHCLFEPSPQKILKQQQRIKDGCRKTGRDPEEIRIASGYQIWLNPSEADRQRRLWMLINSQHMTNSAALEFLDSQPATPDAHIEEIQNLINHGIKVFTFLGEPQELGPFNKQVLQKLK